MRPFVVVAILAINVGTAHAAVELLNSLTPVEPEIGDNLVSFQTSGYCVDPTRTSDLAVTFVSSSAVSE